MVLRAGGRAFSLGQQRTQPAGVGARDPPVLQAFNLPRISPATASNGPPSKWVPGWYLTYQVSIYYAEVWLEWGLIFDSSPRPCPAQWQSGRGCGIVWPLL